jgi:hypothetical protein
MCTVCIQKSHVHNIRSLLQSHAEALTFDAYLKSHAQVGVQALLYLPYLYTLAFLKWLIWMGGL